MRQNVLEWARTRWGERRTNSVFERVVEFATPPPLPPPHTPTSKVRMGFHAETEPEVEPEAAAQPPPRHLDRRHRRRRHHRRHLHWNPGAALCSFPGSNPFLVGVLPLFMDCLSSLRCAQCDDRTTNRSLLAQCHCIRTSSPS